MNFGNEYVGVRKMVREFKKRSYWNHAVKSFWKLNETIELVKHTSRFEIWLLCYRSYIKTCQHFSHLFNLANNNNNNSNFGDKISAFVIPIKNATQFGRVGDWIVCSPHPPRKKKRHTGTQEEWNGRKRPPQSKEGTKNRYSIAARSAHNTFK